MSASLDTRRRLEASRREPLRAVPPVGTGSRTTGALALWAAGVLAAGGLGGIALSGALGAKGRHKISPRSGVLVASATPMTEGAVDDGGSPEDPVVVAKPTFRPVQLTAPEDPFLPPGGLAALTAAKPATDGGAVPASAVPAGKQNAGFPVHATAVPVKPSAPETPAAPKAEEINLTGIIQGDPAVAVVKFGGQSLFLKIGDQVADTWRLVEIKDRSAMFQLGGQRVEITIQGGNSQ